MIGYGASQVIRLAGNLFLTRILFPEAFGLSALVGVFMTGLTMFSDIGIGPSVIRSHRGDDPVFLDTAWTIQVVRGLILWVASVLVALPLAYLYGQPELIRLLPVAGLSALIAGFGSTALFTNVRGLSLARLTILELMTQATSLAAMVVYAYLSRTVWALVVGGLIGTAVRTVLSHIMLEGPPNRFRWNESASREISTLARWILINSAITFLAMQSDRLLLGWLVPLKLLGLYSIATGLAQIPRDVIGKLNNSIVFPLLSRLFRDSDDLLRRVCSIHRFQVFASALVSGVLIASGPLVISVLYDERYTAAGPILSLLGVGALLQTFTASYYSIILTAGRPSHNGYGMATRLAIVILLIGPSYHRFGVPGIAALASLSELGVAAFCFYGAQRLRLAFPWVDIQALMLAATTFLLTRALIPLFL